MRTREAGNLLEQSKLIVNSMHLLVLSSDTMVQSKRQAGKAEMHSVSGRFYQRKVD